MEPKAKTFVLFNPGKGNMQSREVVSRDLAGLELPPHASSYQFFDVLVAEVPHGGETVELRSAPLAWSDLYILQARIVTPGEGNNAVLATVREGDTLTERWIQAICPCCSKDTSIFPNGRPVQILKTVCQKVYREQKLDA